MSTVRFAPGCASATATRSSPARGSRSGSSARPEPRRPLHLALPGALAQLGEHLVCNQEVTGSIPVRSTVACHERRRRFLRPLRARVLRSRLRPAGIEAKLPLVIDGPDMRRRYEEALAEVEEMKRALREHAQNVAAREKELEELRLEVAGRQGRRRTTTTPAAA